MKLTLDIDPDLVARYDAARTVWLALIGDLTVPASRVNAAADVMDDLARVSERLVVMSARGAAVLQDVYGVPERKIDLIPHGIPSVPSASASKDRLGVDGKASWILRRQEAYHLIR